MQLQASTVIMLPMMPPIAINPLSWNPLWNCQSWWPSLDTSTGLRAMTMAMQGQLTRGCQVTILGHEPAMAILVSLDVVLLPLILTKPICLGMDKAANNQT